MDDRSQQITEKDGAVCVVNDHTSASPAVPPTKHQQPVDALSLAGHLSG